jgi:Na+/H+-dicarboxylate symporter
MNILGLVVFSIFFGCTLSRMGPSGKPLADFFECMHIATMKIVTLIIWYSKSKMNCHDIHYMNALLSFQLKQNIWNLLHLLWYFGTVPMVWYFGTVPMVWYFGTVPMMWYFGTVPMVWYF